jgi:hypothetical protein
MRDDERTTTGYIDNDGGIQTAANLWCRVPAVAKAKYGPIASWDTSSVTRMNDLFYLQRNFNDDISRWNVSNVVNMNEMFHGATLVLGRRACAAYALHVPRHHLV